jgi:hypothetical protein
VATHEQHEHPSPSDITPASQHVIAQPSSASLW